MSHLSYHSCESSSVVVWGLNSGTSGDGIDICLCEFVLEPGEKRVVEHCSECIPYPPELRSVLSELNPSAEFLAQFSVYYAKLAAQTINKLSSGCFNSSNKSVGQKNTANNEQDIDDNKLLSQIPRANFIASHGHTFWHQPVAKEFYGFDISTTLQLGCTETLSSLTGLPVYGDFRSADLAIGGQGAPLSAIFDRDFFSDDERTVFVQNIGGIANFTLLQPGKEVIASDTGPGNMLLDLFIKRISGGTRLFDRNSEIARKGRLNRKIFDYLLADPYYELPFPKTTGREKYSQLYLENVLNRFIPMRISNEDIAFTLTALTARTIANSYGKLLSLQSGDPHAVVYLYGGGVKNSLMMELLRGECPQFDFRCTSERGVSPDYKEAITFAYLALLKSKKQMTTIKSVTGAKRDISSGLFSDTNGSE